MSGKLIERFVDALVIELATGDAAPAGTTSDAKESNSGTQKIVSPEPEPVDLLQLARSSFLKPLVRMGAIVTTLFLAVMWRSHRKPQS